MNLPSSFHLLNCRSPFASIACKINSIYHLCFLKKSVEYNGFTVVTIPSPPPKAVPALVVKVEDGTVTPPPTAPPAPETFTVGVTDYTFNPINAIFGRLLHTPDGHVVTLAYWEQTEVVSHDEVPYFDKK